MSSLAPPAAARAGGELAGTLPRLAGRALLEHLELVGTSLLIAAVLALPLALLARRSRGGRGPVSLIAGVLRPLPALAVFALLLPFTGLTRTTVVAGLALLSLAILVRGLLAGLAAVPADVRDTARGTGYSPRRLLLAVELPLALPAVAAALRLAFVTAVTATTVGTIAGWGGLGTLISDGLTRDGAAVRDRGEVLVAAVLCVLVAVAGDLLIRGLLRLATPWQRSAR